MKQLNSSKLPSLIGGAYPDVAMAVGSTLHREDTAGAWRKLDTFFVQLKETKSYK